MKTFKIRDLMIALRPGIGTPQRPQPFDCCLPSCVDVSDDCGADSIQPFLDTGCDDSGCDFTCDDVTCGVCSDFTCGYTEVCGCTGTCGCTRTCGCTKVCTQALTVCGINHSICQPSCFNASCDLSVRQPIENMAPAQLARLKEQLRASAARIKKRESVLAEAAEKKALEPRTVEQVDSLEKLLSEALEALRARRAELQKSAEPKGSQPGRKRKE